MADNVYLKTVNFGGFDKKEVLAYIDKLYSDIYKLEAEVKEKNELIDSLESGEVQDFAGKEELEAKIDEGKSKISELQASNDTLKLQLANYESDVTEKDQKISDMQNEIEDLKEKLQNAEANAGSGGASDFDLGSVFIEAKKTADKVVVEAKKAAKKMEDDAKELQNQILEDANAQASKIVGDAKAQADTTVSEAESKAASMVANAKNEAEVIREQSSGLRASVQAEYTALNENVNKLSDVIRELFGENMVKIDSAKELVEQGLGLVNGNANFNGTQKGSGVTTHANGKKSSETENEGSGVYRPAPAENKKEIKEEVIPEPEKAPEPVVEQVEEVPEEVVQETEEEQEAHTYSSDDVDAAQEYLAKLLAEAEAAEAEEAAEQETVPSEEETAPEPAKPHNFSKSFDLDMLSALTKEIESGTDDDNGNLSDEEFLKKWKNK